jgi:hypothetical protein
LDFDEWEYDERWEDILTEILCEEAIATNGRFIESSKHIRERYEQLFDRIGERRVDICRRVVATIWNRMHPGGPSIRVDPLTIGDDSDFDGEIHRICVLDDDGVEMWSIVGRACLGLGCYDQYDDGRILLAPAEERDVERRDDSDEDIDEDEGLSEDDSEPASSVTTNELAQVPLQTLDGLRTLKDLLHWLAEHPLPEFRLIAAGHAECARWHLYQLAQDTSALVRHAAILNPNVDPSFLEYLYNAPRTEWATQRVILESPACPRSLHCLREQR